MLRTLSGRRNQYLTATRDYVRFECDRHKITSCFFEFRLSTPLRYCHYASTHLELMCSEGKIPRKIDIRHSADK